MVLKLSNKKLHASILIIPIFFICTPPKKEKLSMFANVSHFSKKIFTKLFVVPDYSFIIII